MARSVAAVLFLAFGCVNAFLPAAPQTSRMQVSMSAERTLKEKVVAGFFAASLAFPALMGASPVNAKIDYEGLPYLGGGEKIDVNNANVRVYSRFPGMYPTVAGKIVSHGPYKSVSELYNIPGLSDAEKSILKKYESKFVTLEPAPEYVIDRINNGLYR